MTPGILAAQLEQLHDRWGTVTCRPLPGGATLATVADVTLPSGWSKPGTNIHFLVPPGYPHARPDSFWTDFDLRLAGGGMPQNTQQMPITDTMLPGLWFSWHLATAWDPNKDTLCSWMNCILERVKRPL